MNKKQIITKIHTKALIGRLAQILLLCLLLGTMQPVQAQSPYPSPTTITITSVTPNPAFINQPVVIHFSVVANNPGASTPNGYVEIRSGINPVCLMALDAAGTGTCTLTFNTPAIMPLKAIYLGTHNYIPDDSPEINLVVKDKYTPAAVVTSHLPDPSAINHPVNVSVQLSSAGPVPTGSVTVRRSNVTCTAPSADFCTANLTAGNGSCSLTLTSPGTVHLCAQYGGDTYTYPALAPAVEHFVSDSNSITVITDVDPEPSVLGEAVWVHFQVSSPVGTPMPTETVRVSSGGLSCMATVQEGGCQLIFSTPHLNDIIASYQPASQQLLEPSISRTWVHRVNAAPIDILLSNDSVGMFAAPGKEIAILSATDPNPDETHIFTLAAGAGDEHNSFFRISNDRLLVNGRIPDNRSVLSIRVRAADPSGLTFEKVFSLRVIADAVLPATGFAAGRVTHLLPQPFEKSYQKFNGVMLEIPTLGVQAKITGVPNSADGWDTSWLWNQVGWLNGTAFPSWRGNSVLAAHNYLPNGVAGPFSQLQNLRWGDRILVYAFNETHVYEVRSIEIVRPEDSAVLAGEETPWLTLVTCKSFDEESGSYRWRVVVRAEWVEVY